MPEIDAELIYKNIGDPADEIAGELYDAEELDDETEYPEGEL